MLERVEAFAEQEGRRPRILVCYLLRVKTRACLFVVVRGLILASYLAASFSPSRQFRSLLTHVSLSASKSVVGIQIR